MVQRRAIWISTINSCNSIITLLSMHPPNIGEDIRIIMSCDGQIP